MSVDDKLLREYVRAVLSEDDGGGDSGMGTYGDLAMWDAANSPWGVSFGSGNDLFNIFVKPFTDVFQTTAGKTKELTQKGMTLARVALEATVTTLVPVLTDSYNEIFAKEEERIDKIRGQYAEVYQSTWDAFKDEDFQFLMFMYSPAAYINAKVIKKSPKAALGLISVLTGGTIDSYLDKVKKAFGITDEPEGPHRAKKEKNISGMGGGGGMGGYDIGWGGDGGGHGGDGGGHGAMEGVIREDDQSNKGSKPTLEQVLSNPKLLAKISESPLAQKMQRQAQELIQAPLQQVYKQAQAVLRANSLQDLQQKLGKKLPGIEKLAGVEPQARQAAEQQVMKGVKGSMRLFYVKSLEKQAKQFEGSPAAQAYKHTIGKIKSL
jgi:hypothetical protein